MDFTARRLGIPLLVTLLLMGPLKVFAQEGKVTKLMAEDIPQAKVWTPSKGLAWIQSKGSAFVDPTGRTLFLRGINLAGSSKIPLSPPTATHVREEFFEGETVSFVGRPFPLAEADAHFERLKAWGFHFLRFLVTWEAIEHAGPGQYDRDYLAYLRQMIQKAGEHGFSVLIDPHQDVWSRFTGGDGAPLWTLEVAGINPQVLQESGTALVHNLHGDPFPQMGWYTNYYKMACATMFTLFYGGNDFAPQLQVEGEPIQDFLQQHYINALCEVAKAVRDLPNVLGFELMNEPSAGWIGIEDLGAAYEAEILGDAPTPYEGMLLGAGIPRSVQSYRLGAMAIKDNGKPLLNPSGTRIWEGEEGIWQQHKVWSLNETGVPQLLQPNYFHQVKGEAVDFNRRYYAPFAKAYAAALLKIQPSWMICVDEVLFPYEQPLPDLKQFPGVRWINGSHWYDEVTLAKKKYLSFIGLKDRKVVFGKRRVAKAFKATLAELVAETEHHYGAAPSLLGEFGIPFDLNQKKAFRTGNFKAQRKALDRSMRAVEANRLSYTLWNYTPDNDNARGDQWNGEDLSIYSPAQLGLYEGINDGGRALEVVVRPAPRKVAGQLTHYAYHFKSRTLEIEFKPEKGLEFPTEVFLPAFVYGDQFEVALEGGRLAYDAEARMLLIYAEEVEECSLVVKPIGKKP